MAYTESPIFRPATIIQQFEQVVAAESTRHGGISPAPFASLNLGINTPDDPTNIEENRLRFCSALGILPTQLASAHHSHGTDVLYVTEPGHYESYDALITDQPNLFLAARTADCTPILIYDNQHRAMAAIHAGWRGTAAGIVSITLQAMQTRFDTRPGACFAYVGTCIDETSFEVGPEVADQFSPAFKRQDTYTGTWFVNLKSANSHQLTNFGIPASQIGISTFSTVLNNEDYFSHRAEEGKTGRMLAVIGIKF